MRIKHEKYDERQQLARGKAFRAAYFVLLAYLVINGFISYVLEIEWSDALTGLFIGICVSATVFVVLSVRNDAYISMRDRPGSFIILFSIFCFVCLASGIMNQIYGNYIIVNGQLTTNALNFIVGIMYLVTLPFLIIKSHANKKDAESEQS